MNCKMSVCFVRAVIFRLWESNGKEPVTYLRTVKCLWEGLLLCGEDSRILHIITSNFRVTFRGGSYL